MPAIEPRSASWLSPTRFPLSASLLLLSLPLLPSSIPFFSLTTLPQSRLDLLFLLHLTIFSPFFSLLSSSPPLSPRRHLAASFTASYPSTEPDLCLRPQHTHGEALSASILLLKSTSEAMASPMTTGSPAAYGWPPAPPNQQLQGPPPASDVDEMGMQVRPMACTFFVALGF